VRDDVEVVGLDLTDEDAVARAVAAARPDVVFHLAAHGAYSWQQDAARMIEVNLQGAVALLAACEATGVATVVHAGSSSEYGFKDHAPSEDEPLEPNSAYAVSKAAATQYCSLVGRSSGARVVTLRLYSVYGPWEDPRRLIPRLIVHGLDGRLPPLADPDTARDFVYLDDACAAFLAAAGDGAGAGSVYNVGSGVQTTLREIVELARAELGIEAEPQWGSGEQRAWDTADWRSDPRAIEHDLGWRVRISLRDGVRATAQWLRSRGDLLERVYRPASA
jgi:dolichol-phosphate mannosyltransferase